MKTGIHAGIPNEAYHADKALSNSGAKLLLPPSTPSHYRWAMDHPQPRKDEFDFGTVAHRLALEGNEDGLVIVEYDTWRTKDSQKQRDDAAAEGKIALLEKDVLEVRAMVEKLREHPLVVALLSNGKAEQSAFWNDPLTGAPLRARFDWLPNLGARGRFILSDYKTAMCANTREFGDSAARYRYHMQQAFYKAAASVLLGVEDPSFLFIVQEKKAPYAVNVIELDSEAERMGRELMRRAVDLYAHCTETGVWPGYQGVASAVLPVWATYEHQEIFDAA